MSANLSAILYLVSGVLFILALRGLSSPETSRQGNLFGIIGMVIAVTVTFLSVGNFSSGFVYVLIFLVIGAPDIIPCNFKNAITDPEKVIAPTAAPIAISIKLASLIFPGVPRLNADGLINAEIATNTAAKPTKLWKPATNSGIAVIGIRYAINAPILPPIAKNIRT